MANIFGGILINSTILTDYGVKMNRRGCKCRFCVHLQLASRGRIFIWCCPVASIVDIAIIWSLQPACHKSLELG